ncbi:peptidoglycan-binding protein [Coleofasciculus sp. G2-EDA-02]|uniref:peptidoglycan-binding protein n=1 Tax=Coleofasciculus sp. G2-EDA-02 TaxID=3069529 RepID=UPI0032F9F565
MENPASIHLAVTDEALATSEPPSPASSRLFIPELDSKKRLSAAWIPFIFLTMALFIVSLASPVLALRKGTSGAEVTNLQKTLQAEGYFTGPITGYYGPLTEAAVIQFQKANGLNPDGIVGANTTATLKSDSAAPTNSSIDSQTPTPLELDSPTPEPDKPLVSARPNFILQRGDRNPQVTSLQRNLQVAGYFSGPITGYYGSTTQDAVIQLQKAHGLTVDGIAGSQTRAALESKPISSSSQTPPSTEVTEDRIGFANPGLVLKRGSRNSDVTALQRTLKEQGYYDGPLTGYYGSLTETAVIQFQKAKGLNVDGMVGSSTKAALELPSPAVTPSPIESPTAQLNQDSFSTPEENSDDTPFNQDSFIEPEENYDTSPSNQDSFSTPTENSDNSPFNQDSFTNEDSEKKKDNEQRQSSQMTLKHTIAGKISPKSIVHSGRGLFFAQNMMYSHTITVYDRQYNLVKTIADAVNLQKYGHSKGNGTYKGSPVEAAFSDNGQYAWVSNYQMYGSGFNKPGSDKCDPSQKTDNSFLYRINTDNLEIDQVIEVGSVPKFVATSPDNRLVLVSNWCSWDLSVVDSQQNQEVRRIKLGRYPRGIVVDRASQKAYVAVMGSYDIAVVDLNDFSLDWIKNIGNSPRHLSIDPADQYLYATLNGEGTVAKIDLATGKVLRKVATGNAPRSMDISDDGQFMYVVNYHSNTMSKVRTSDMSIQQTVNTNANPIGITYDPETNQVWVACYSGAIMVFQD